MNDGRTPWKATYWEAGTWHEVSFAKLTEALDWIGTAGDLLDLDPEHEGAIELSYAKLSEDWTAGMGDGALIMNRIACTVIDGYAGGAGNYRLQNGAEEFWVGEPEDNDSDFILFAKEDR